MTDSDKSPQALDRAQHRRNQVLDAARQCFARRGFHSTSMAEISKTAGMSAGHIYNYFDSKDAIITAFVERDNERVGLLIRDLREQSDPLQLLLDSIDEHVTEALDPEMSNLQVEIFAEAMRNPVIAKLLQDSDREIGGQFLEIVSQARAERGLSIDRAMLEGRLDVICCLFHGLPVRVLHNPRLDRMQVTDGFRLVMRTLLLEP